MLLAVSEAVGIVRPTREQLMDTQLHLCEYCDHPPYHSAKLLARHMERKHSDDGIALFNRDMTYRTLRRKATRVALAIKAAGHWGSSNALESDDVWKACYDSLIDLLLSGQPVTNRNIRRGAWKVLLNDNETSLDEMMLGDEDSEDTALYAVSHAFSVPDVHYVLTEALLEVAQDKFAIDDPTVWLGVTELNHVAVLLTGYDALLANTEDALEAYQASNRKADERRGRPRKATV